MGSFEIFSYWNLAELQLTFNAIASIVGGGDFLGLLRTIGLVGLISMAMAILAGFSQLPDFGRWIIMLAVFNGMLLVPKVNVLLTDRTGGQASIVVANVPVGLAGFASSISHIGDWLTRTYETTFSVIPNDMSFVSHGALWGQRVQQEILHTKFSSSTLQTNLLDFYRECVVPEYATGFIVASDMAKSTDIWLYLNGRTNPGRFVTVRAMTGSAVVSGTYGCDMGYTLLTDQINVDSASNITTLGNYLFPKQAVGTANAAMISSIQTSTNYILGVSQTAMESVRQTAMANFMIDAQYNLPAQIGDAAGAAANLAQAQAIRSTSDSYKLIAKISESTMPKIKNIVEIVQYAVFPIIILLVLMAGHKGGLVLKAYVMSLVWVQLWPPLYAVMNMIMTLHAQELATMTAGMGLSMADYSLLNNAYISDEAIAGMIAATAIPTIAAAIVKGGDVGVQAIGGAVSGSSQQATQAAAAASQGNFSMGNASLGNQSADNLSMGKMNTRSEYTHGGMSDTGADNVSHFHGSQGEVINNSAAMQNVGTNLKASGKTAGSLTKTGEQMESASREDVTAAGTAMSTAMSQFRGLEHGHGRGTRTGMTDTTSSTAAFKESYAQEQNLIDKYAQEHGFNQSQKADFAAYVRAEASGGVTVPFVGGVTVSGGTSAIATSSAQIAKAQKEAKEFAHGQKYSSAVDRTNQAMRSKDFASGEDSTSKAAKGIRASLEQSSNSMQSASAKHTKAGSYKEASSRVTENAAAFDTNANNQFMSWMQSQKNPTSGNNFTASDVEQMSRTNNLGEYAQRFVDEKLTPKAVEQYMPIPQNHVQEEYDKNKQEIATQADIQNQGNANLTTVAQQQTATGLTPGAALHNDVTKTVDAQLGDANAAIHKGDSAIEAGGKPLEENVKHDAKPGNVSVAGVAAANALNTVTPSGASLANDAGILPNTSMAKEEADDRGGSVGGHVKGLLVEGVTTAVGGVAAKAIAKVVAPIAGKYAGSAARAGEEKALTELEKRAANRAAAKPVEAPVPEGGAVKAEAPIESAATKSVEGKISPEATERIEKGADRAGVKTEQEAYATTTGALKVAGVITGAGVGQGINSGNVNEVFGPAIEATKKTDAAVLDTVKDIGSSANKVGNQIVDAVIPNDKR